MSVSTRVRNGITYALTAFGVAGWYRHRMRTRGPLTRIIVFHDVPDKEWFRSLIDVLVAHTNVLTPESFVSGVRDHDRYNVLVTFDDGYASWVDVALPVLRDVGVKALFFVNSGLLDAAPSPHETERFMREQLRIRPRVPLTWEGAASLIREGHTIGGHARMHEDFRILTDEALTHTIQADREGIQSKLGISPIHFAYPFGTSAYVTPNAITAVRSAGYTYGYTAESGFVVPGETFTIPRMCIDDDMTPDRLMNWIGGSYDVFTSVRRKLRA